MHPNVVSVHPETADEREEWRAPLGISRPPFAHRSTRRSLAILMDSSISVCDETKCVYEFSEMKRFHN